MITNKCFQHKPRHTAPNYRKFNNKEALIKQLRMERRRCYRLGLLQAVRVLEKEICEMEAM